MSYTSDYDWVLIIIYSGLIFTLVSSFLIPTIAPIEKTVTDIEYEESGSIYESDTTTYYGELSSEEQSALESGVASNELSEYMSPEQSTYASGKIITDSGIYTIRGQVDYGMYTPFIKYRLLGFLPGFGFLLYTLARDFTIPKNESSE